MPKHDSVRDKLAELQALGQRPYDDAVREGLLRGLEHASNVIVAQAAELMGRFGKAEFVPPLLAHGEKLLGQGMEADKGCRAKEAIVCALDTLGNTEESVYLRGMRCIQMEPVFGGRADVAANLRGCCAQALARMLYAEAHLEIAHLLVDLEMPARLAAVRAIAYLGDEKSELLLRMKVLAGDADSGVLNAAFAGLLAIEPARSVSFCAGFLADTDAPSAEPAALALGESRLPEALAALRTCWDTLADYTFRKTLLLAIALHRSDEAFDFLLTIIREEGRSAALKALEVLDIYRAEEKRCAQIQAAVQANSDALVREAFQAQYR